MKGCSLDNLVNFMWVSVIRYTIVLMYYALSVGLLFLFRPIISHQLCDGQGRASTYAALYFLPSLAVLQALFGGLICKYNNYTFINKRNDNAIHIA